MAQRARTELGSELERFWRDEVHNGRKPWRERPKIAFARFLAWNRLDVMNEVPELAQAELNMLQSRILVRFGEFLEVQADAKKRLELELAEGFLVSPPVVRVVRTSRTSPVIPHAVAPGDYTRGRTAQEEGLVREIADAVRRMKGALL